MSSAPKPFRRLRADELAEIEPQFVRYLAAQGIPADLWEQLKREDEPRVGELLDGFSQLVYEDVLARIKFLEQREARQLLCFSCDVEVVKLRGVIVEGDTSIDLRSEEDSAVLLARLQASGANLKLLAAERAYRPDRPTDLFMLLERGAKIANSSQLYDLLDGATP